VGAQARGCFNDLTHSSKGGGGDVGVRGSIGSVRRNQGRAQSIIGEIAAKRGNETGFGFGAGAWSPLEGSVS